MLFSFQLSSCIYLPSKPHKVIGNSLWKTIMLPYISRLARVDCPLAAQQRAHPPRCVLDFMRTGRDEPLGEMR
jgi:hypothetical protein